jgi:hypothetical protein
LTIEFDTGERRSLALSLRSLDGDDVTFITEPKRRYATINEQSVVIVDKQPTQALFDAVANDNIDSSIDEYGKADVLGTQKTVSKNAPAQAPTNGLVQLREQAGKESSTDRQKGPT